MSLEEILVIIIVAILLIKPEDLPIIFTKIQSFQQYLAALKRDLYSSLNHITKESVALKQDTQEINFYLHRIIDIVGFYDGDYSIESLKTRYNELVQQALEERKLK
jgi:Sec-independent protein translocase protein TatA